MYHGCHWRNKCLSATPNAQASHTNVLKLQKEKQSFPACFKLNLISVSAEDTKHSTWQQQKLRFLFRFICNMYDHISEMEALYKQTDGHPMKGSSLGTALRLPTTEQQTTAWDVQDTSLRFTQELGQEAHSYPFLKWEFIYSWGVIRSMTPHLPLLQKENLPICNDCT